MTISATEIRTLGAAPANLSADVNADVSVTSCWFAIQNLGASEIRFKEGGASPAADDLGHTLGAGDLVVLLVLKQRDFWLWTPTAGATYAISPGGPAPVRTT